MRVEDLIGYFFHANMVVYSTLQVMCFTQIWNISSENPLTHPSSNEHGEVHLVLTSVLEYQIIELDMLCDIGI